MPIIFVILLLTAGIIFPKLIQFNRSRYKEESGNSFFATIGNTKRYGEFLAFTYLEEYEIHRKIITNRYLPGKDQAPQRLELIMINEGGVYLFDVNSYKATVQGDPGKEPWTWKGKKKEGTLHNPFLMNQERIRRLKEVFPRLKEVPIKPFVLFNNDSTLKIEGETPKEGKLLKMQDLIRELNEEISRTPTTLSPEEVDHLYEAIKKGTERVPG